MIYPSIRLTDLYNLFHTRDLTPAQVAKGSKKSAEEGPTLIISPLLALMGNFLTRGRTAHRFGCWWLSKSHFLRRTRNLQPN